MASSALFLTSFDEFPSFDKHKNNFKNLQKWDELLRYRRLIERLAMQLHFLENLKLEYWQ